MSFAFASWGDFLAMGGYGFYVWLAVALTVFPLLILVIHTCSQRRTILHAVTRQQAREKRILAAQHAEGTE